MLMLDSMTLKAALDMAKNFDLWGSMGSQFEYYISQDKKYHCFARMEYKAISEKEERSKAIIIFSDRPYEVDDYVFKVEFEFNWKDVGDHDEDGNKDETAKLFCKTMNAKVIKELEKAIAEVEHREVLKKRLRRA